MFEIKHLKTLTTLAATGNIRKTAEKLFVSQSALSHQIKDLEQRLNTPLFIRNTSPVQFTAAGEVLLKLADDILPKISAASNELKADNNTDIHLQLAIACHACFQWLIPVIDQFSPQYPALKINFVEQTFFNQSAIDQSFYEQSFAKKDQQSSTENIDILFIDEKTENDQYIYHALGTYEVVGVLARENNTISQPFLTAEDISQQVLLTYPVKSEDLDLFKLFINKKLNKTANKNTQSMKCQHKPKAIKQVANSHMILQMVAANMGISALPAWLVSSLSQQSLVQTKRIGEKGIYKTLYARYNAQSPHIDIIKQLIPQAVIAFEKINNAKL